MTTTITRYTTVLTPTLVLGWSLTRPGRSVVHDILGTSDVEVTVRAPGPRAGDLRTFWATEAAAAASVAALSVPGAPWVWEVSGVLGAALTAYVVGDVQVEAADDAGHVWTVTVGVQEIAP